MRKDGDLYLYNISPLTKADIVVDGEKYVTSNGDILVSNNGFFYLYKESPLDSSMNDNVMENLTDTQLNLFWVLCK